jgi:hypothetical protein
MGTFLKSFDSWSQDWRCPDSQFFGARFSGNSTVTFPLPASPSRWFSRGIISRCENYSEAEPRGTVVLAAGVFCQPSATLACKFSMKFSFALVEE